MKRPPVLPRRWAAALAMLPPALAVAGLTAAGLIDGMPAIVIGLALLAGLWWLERARLAKDDAQRQPLPSPEGRVPQDFLERLPDPVILLNGAREIVAVNGPAREALGVGLLGRDLALSLRHPDVLAAVEAVVAGLPPVTQEITLPVPVPRTFTLHVGILSSAGPDPGPGWSLADDPQAPRVVLVLRDETRAKRAEQSRADFVANASHELRSPLSALIGFIETLRGPASDDAVARDRFLGVMQAEAQRMARLVEDLMSLSRVEINEHVPPRERVRSGAIVLAGVAETLAVRADQAADDDRARLPRRPAAGDRRDRSVDPGVPQPRRQRRQVRAAPERRSASSPGRSTACPARRAAGVSVAVIDQGDGIEAIHLPRLTERFYRADEGRSRRLGGTGLGLAIVKHIVNRHRGRLMIDSKVGDGSTVHGASAGGRRAASPQRDGRRRRRSTPRRPGGDVIKP